MDSILILFTSMAPYLLLGFFLAGLMHAFVPGNVYQKHLGQPTFKSVLYATLIAIPLPLCSCGVIPTAMSLRREGASKGSVISFLIATPQTGVDSILATYSLMGLPFAIVRPIAALVTALFGGTLANSLHSKLDEKDSDGYKATPHPDQKSSFWKKLRVAVYYAFFDMMQDIGRWLVVGLFIAGLITIYVPDSFFGLFADNTLLSIFFVLLVAIPMYVCATGSIPIAIALMMKGLSPGAALVLLMAGPAVNVASILIIKKVMGWKALLTYLVSIILGATAFALIIDYGFERDVFMSALTEHGACGSDSISVFNWICSGILALLLINALYHRFFGGKIAACSCGCEEGACTLEATDKVMIKVEGMKCNHCRTNVENAILAVSGVTHAEVSLQTSEAAIEGDFKMEDIVASVEGLGFKVVQPEKKASAAKPIVIKVEGMKCNHCRTNVENAILAVPGVTHAEVSLQTSEAAIEGDFKMDDIIASVEGLGFTVIKP